MSEARRKDTGDDPERLMITSCIVLPVQVSHCY